MIASSFEVLAANVWHRCFSIKRLSQLALDLVVCTASQAYVERLFSLCGDL